LPNKWRFAMKSIKHFFAIILACCALAAMSYGFLHEIVKLDKPFYVTKVNHSQAIDFYQSDRAKPDEAIFRKFVTGGMCFVLSISLIGFSLLALLLIVKNETDSIGMSIGMFIGSIFFIIWMAPIFWKSLCLIGGAVYYGW
jgi:hypothetical protein